MVDFILNNIIILVFIFVTIFLAVNSLIEKREIDNIKKYIETGQEQ